MAARKKRAPAQTSFLKPAPQIKDNNVLDVAEAAALLKVSKETIYKRVRDNAIPHARLGRKLLFHKQTLTQWVADGGDRASNAGEGDQLSLEQAATEHRPGPHRLKAVEQARAFSPPA